MWKTTPVWSGRSAASLQWSSHNHLLLLRRAPKTKWWGEIKQEKEKKTQLAHKFSTLTNIYIFSNLASHQKAICDDQALNLHLCSSSLISHQRPKTNQMCLALLNSGNTALNILKVWSHLTCLLFPSVCIYRVSFNYAAKVTTFIRRNAHPSYP